MSRPHGSHDRRPRQMNPLSLQNIRRHVQGLEHVRLSIYAEPHVVRWFAGFETRERGRLVAQLRNQILG